MITKLKSNSEFTKNVLTLVTGTTIAQALPILISPFLTRIYSPQDFGILALFIAIVSILSTFANGRYAFAIMLPKKDKYAINIFILGLLISLVVSILIFIAIVFFNNSITNFLENKSISVWLYFVPIVVFFTSFYSLLTNFNNRKKFYKDISQTTIIKSIVTGVVQLLIGLIKNGVTGLILGQLVATVVANMKLLRNIINDKVLMSNISKSKMKVVAKKYIDFPKYNALSALFDTVAIQLPFLFLVKVYTDVILGFYYLAMRIVFLPSILITNSIGQVFFQTMSESNKNGELCLPLLIKTIKKLFLLSITLSLLIYFLSPIIFPIVFGDKWVESGEIAKYLAFIFFIRFIVSPLSSALLVSDSIKSGAYWQYLYFITTVILFSYVTFMNVEFYNFLFLLVLHEIVLYIIYLFLIIIKTKQLDAKNARSNLCVE